MRLSTLAQLGHRAHRALLPPLTALPRPRASLYARRRPSLQAARAQHSDAGSSSTSSSSSSSSNGSSSVGWLDIDTTPLRSDYDAVLVLGGGLLPKGGLPPWVARRLDGALHIYHQQSRPCPILLLGAGTPHKPPVINSGGFVLHESTAYADYLIEQGVPARQLLKEVQSYDTVGNGYFSLTIHAVPAGWRRLAVVTSDFHMPRTAATFDVCYGLAAGQGMGGPFQLDYHPVSDAGLFDPEVLAARVAKEAAATAAWHANACRLGCVADFHAWLFETHLCYSVSRQGEFGKERDLDPRLAATY